MGTVSTRVRQGLASAILLAVIGVVGAPSESAQANGCRYADTNANHLSGKKARKAIRCQVNAHRNAVGIGDLSGNRRLRKAAARHTRRMTSNNCFAHQCPGEGPLATRLYSTGYLLGGLSSWGYAENIAWGQGNRSTPRNIVGAWMNSPPHRANILNPSFEHLGVGFRDGAPTTQNAGAGTYTLDLGRRD